MCPTYDEHVVSSGTWGMKMNNDTHELKQYKDDQVTHKVIMTDLMRKSMSLKRSYVVERYRYDV